MGKERIAIYAGTFDPITDGHLDIVTRGAQLFDRLIVAVSENPRKGPLFHVDERVELVQRVIGHLDNVSVISFHKLLVDLAIEQNASTIIKGIRAVSDFEYELQLALTNRRLAPEVDTVYLLPSEEHTFISSSVIKEVAAYGGDVSSMVPAAVLTALQKKFEKESPY